MEDLAVPQERKLARKGGAALRTGPSTLHEDPCWEGHETIEGHRTSAQIGSQLRGLCPRGCEP